MILAVLALVGCDKQRDLYVTAGPMIYVEGDWIPSLGKDDMSMDATAVLFNASGPYAKDYFFNPDNVTVPVDQGMYDVLIFNGLMYSEEDTHVSNVFFRGTDDISTFEAVAREAAPNKRLSKAESGYIASNDMDIITSAFSQQGVTGDNAYYLKYQNGKNGFDIPDSYIEAELYMTPMALSYECQVIVTIKNITSAYAANAAIYGFVGSAYMASRRPTHFYVTHQFNLNSKKMFPGSSTTGTIESPVFVTFGPPVDAPENNYEIYISIVLVDGSELERTIDVTDQVNPFIEKIRDNLEGKGDPEYNPVIAVELDLELPIVDPIKGSIGVGDWDDDEIIKVPITL